ncbi:MAG: SDR family NAD(P)-dependent oxidoreductase [Myxococcales bacterium]
MRAESCTVITGGSSGLGLALAEALALRGQRLVLVARDRNRLERAVATLQSRVPAANVHALALDVTNVQQVHAAFAELPQKHGQVALLINSAGALREGPFEELSDQDARALMEVNYFGALNAIRAALPQLRRTRGRILNIASMAALTGVYGYTAYCGSKHALLGASEALRAELAPQGVRVQVLCPGEFDSPMIEELDRYRTPENRAHTLAIPKTPVPVIVRDTLAGLESERFLLIPGAPARLTAMALRHAPALVRWVGDLRIRTAAKKR